MMMMAGPQAFGGRTRASHDVKQSKDLVSRISIKSHPIQSTHYPGYDAGQQAIE